MKTKEAVKHTPGPWATDDCSVVHANGEPIAEIYDGRKTFRADARLIAAAPDLLAFVQMLVDGAENDKPEPADLMDKAKALVLRATGGK
jgi:hypothetical protein